jgi:hypothetical protein
MAVIVSTDPADDLTAYAAILNGSLTDMDGNTSLDVYFEWGPTDEYGETTTPETLAETGVFDAGITGLESHTTYHFRAVATDGVDHWYSADTTLFTLYTFKPDTPLNLQGEPGPFTILWSWEDPYFLWSQITVTVGGDGVPYTYPKGIGLRYAPVVAAPDLSVIAETPITEDGLSLLMPEVPGINVSSTVFQKIEGVTISIADPCVVTFEDHGLSDEAIVKFTTTGALPEEVIAGSLYFVDLINADTFYLEYNIDGEKLVTTAGSQSGTHTLWYKL